MFVFPAFDSNYQTRKRVYRCCERCRTKRVKCRVASKGSGCVSCINSSSPCSFVPTQPPVSTLPPTQTGSVNTTPNVERNIVNDSGNSSRLAQYLPPLPTPQAKPIEMTNVTPQFLKKMYNFNISGMSAQRAYQYVFHDHPKVIFTNKTNNDRTLYRESGIHVDYQVPLKSDNPSSFNWSQQKAPGGSNSTNTPIPHIRDRRTFDYLLSINAFSITHGPYSFTNEELNKFIDLYFTKINSVFPLVSVKGFWDEFNAGALPSVLMYTIVLLMSKDSLATPMLSAMFAREGRTRSYDVEYLEFTADLQNKIRQIVLILPQLGDYDKLTRLSSSLLLSLHYGYDRFGNERASHDLTDAVNMAFSLGMHMKRQPSELTQERIDHLNDMWWCVYVFDRFNALVNCRSLFIRNHDFNIDPPHNSNLKKLVEVARSLEEMLHEVYRPNHKNAPHYRKSIFDMVEFENKEFKLCDLDQMDNKVEGGETYIASTVNFVTRVVKNVIILASQKAKYDDPKIPNSLAESISLKASSNILWYIQRQPPHMMINIPIIPWCLSLALAASLKSKARKVLEYKLDSEGTESVEDMDNTVSITQNYEWTDYVKELDSYCKRWWVVDEICKLSTEFGKKLEKKEINQKKNIEHDLKRRKVTPAAPPIPPIPNNVHDILLPTPTPAAPPALGNVSLSRVPTMDFSSLSYDDYFGSLPINLFDNELFMDFPHVQPSTGDNSEVGDNPNSV
ncbi:hypothetical protein CAAN3_08S02542 [[Candida] anglica]